MIDGKEVKVYSKYILPDYFVLMTIPVMKMKDFKESSFEGFVVEFYAIDLHDLMSKIIGKPTELLQSDIYNAKKLTQKYIKFIKKIIHNIFFLHIYKLSQKSVRLKQENY